MAVILVTGSNGQLGSEIKKLATNFKDFNFLFTDVNELDITSVNDVNAFFPANHPDVVINCAAYTAVDKAESEPEQAHLINAVAVKNLAESCKKYNAFLVHTSTDYVFDGKKDSPYLETDRINPQSAYGRSKAEGEEYVLQIAPKSIIVRTSWLYSSVGNNFVKTIIRVAREKGKLNVVNDQFGSPTYAADMAKSILDIIASGKILPSPEIFHYSNEGIISWFDFAKAIIEIKKIDCQIEPVPTSGYPTVAERPGYSAFSKEKIQKTYGVSIPGWRESLETCLSLID